MHKAAMDATELKTEPVMVQPRRAAKILCIDDDDLGLEIRRLVLESEGYETLTATSGPDGLSVLAEHAVDCVVLDFRMPEMDGSAVAIEIKRNWPQLPVIMFSGYPDEIPAETLWLVEASLSKADGPQNLLRELAKQLAQSEGRKKPS